MRTLTSTQDRQSRSKSDTDEFAVVAFEPVPSPARTFRPKLHWLAAGAVAGPAIFTLGWLVLETFGPGFHSRNGELITPYSALSQSISGLGIGATAPLMNTVFVLSGILTLIGLSGVAGFLRGEPEDLPYRTLFVLLGLPALGAVTDGVFTLRDDFMHSFGFALALTSIAGFPFCGFVLRRSPGWRGFGTWLVGGGALTLVLTVALTVTFKSTPRGAGGAGLGGLTERVLVTQIMAWYVALGWRTMAGPGRFPTGADQQGRVHSGEGQDLHQVAG